MKEKILIIEDDTTVLLFALQSAILSVILEWNPPIRDWKTESDLWHHPRKYVLPLVMLLVECGALLYTTRMG